MAKQRKPSSNVQAFEREVKRLQRLLKVAENKGIIFISSPIPEKPKVVTRKKLNLIQSITKSDIESKGYTLDILTGELQSYVPLKKSKARTSTYSANSTAPHITKPSKSKLSTKELHKVRSEAAKKAAQTRRKREQEDEEYKKRINEMRRKSLEKAREAKRKKREQEQQEYPETQVEQEQESKIEKPYYAPDYSELPLQGDAILANVRAELSGAVNSNIAQYLLDLLEDEIDANGKDAVIERLAKATERAIEMANGASYASSGDDIANCAYSLADLITGGEIGGFMAEEIDQLAFEDSPYRRRRR